MIEVKPPRAVMLMPFFLGELHGIEHFAPRRLEAAQHFRHEAGIDVGTGDGLAGGAGDFDVFHELWGRTAPDIKIAPGDVIETEI